MQAWGAGEGGQAIAKAQNLHFQVIHHDPQLPATYSAALIAAFEEDLEALETLTGKACASDFEVEVHLYKDVEQMGLLIGVQEQEWVDFEKREIHWVASPVFDGKPSGESVRLIIRHLLGTSHLDLLEYGLAARQTPDLYGIGHLQLAARLHQSGFGLQIADLLDPERMKYVSPIVRSAFAGALVDYLVEKRGLEFLLDHYAEKGKQLPWHTLQAGFDQWLDELPGSPLPSRRDELPHIRGMTMAHEGYRVYNGYGSAQCRQALSEVKNLGANTVSIVPYTGLRELDRPVPIAIWRYSGAENDAVVLTTLYDAEQLGLRTLLKPQIWVHGSWPGGIAMQTEKDWDMFFDYYRDWILHYALMAEICEVDIFCMGVELQEATRQRPGDWRRLANDLRGIYGGYLTYAANWGEEVNKLSFADALDFMGVDFYYSLSDESNPGIRELRRGAEKVLDELAALSRERETPILLTELGYRSATQSWKDPWAEVNGRSTDQDAQALCYRAIIEALRDREEVVGTIWWKWSTATTHSRRRSTGFTAKGKVAEAILRQAWWEKR